RREARRSRILARVTPPPHAPERPTQSPLQSKEAPVATKILVSPKFPAAMLDIAKSYVPVGFEMIVADAGTPQWSAAPPEIAYFVGFPRTELNTEFFKAASGLKLIQLISAGYDRLDVGAAKRAGVPIANNGGSNSVAVAEHTLMLMLAVYRKLS